MKKRRNIRINNATFDIRKTRVVRKYIYFVIFAFITVVSIYSITINVTSGVKLSSLEREATEIEKENNELSAKLFEKSSLLKIQQVAEGTGFINPQEMLYIRGEESVAVVP